MPSVVTKTWESVGETMISHVFWMKLAFLVWKLTAVCISISLWRCTGSDKKHPWNWTWEARKWFYNGEFWTTCGSSARSCGCCIYVGNIQQFWTPDLKHLKPEKHIYIIYIFPMNAPPNPRVIQTAFLVVTPHCNAERYSPAAQLKQ